MILMLDYSILYETIFNSIRRRDLTVRTYYLITIYLFIDLLITYLYYLFILLVTYINN